MTIGWALLMWAAIVWLVPLIYHLLKNECRPKKNIIVGVTLPLDAQQDPEVQAVLARFQKEMRWICWLSLAVIVPTLFIRSFGAFLTAWIAWCVAICFVFFIPYARCNGALRRLKEARGWRREDSAQMVVDLQAAAEGLRPVSPWWFLPPLLIALIPLLFERELWPLWAVDAAMVPVSYICCRWLYRGRAELAGGDSARTLALTRIRRYNWGKFWLITAWATGLFSVGLWLTLDRIWLCMAVTLAYALVVCVSALSVELRVRRMQEELGNRAEGYVDEDDRWIWGMFYYAPNDRRMLVNARVGINTTVNLARRPVQVLMALVLAALLACPLAGVWLMDMERAPVELSVTEGRLVGAHFGGEWSVALEDIQSVELLEERPPLSRVAGTAMASAMTGAYRNGQRERFTCCLDPRTGPWLLVTDREGQRFLFGSSTPGGVEQVLAELG